MKTAFDIDRGYQKKYLIEKPCTVVWWSCTVEDAWSVCTGAKGGAIKSMADLMDYLKDKAIVSAPLGEIQALREQIRDLEDDRDEEHERAEKAEAELKALRELKALASPATIEALAKVMHDTRHYGWLQWDQCKYKAEWRDAARAAIAWFGGRVEG